MKREIMRGMRVPGWERASEAAREAVLEELVSLPVDIGEHPVREQAPACARITEVIDALKRAAERPGITERDRALIDSWQALGHAGSIAMFLDIAILAARDTDANALSLMAPDSDSVARLGTCAECDEPVLDTERHKTAVHLESPEATPRVVIIHWECMVLRAFGHYHGICGCTNYGGIPTTREQAREVMRRIEAGVRAGMS